MAEMLYRKRGKRYVPEPELSALAPFDAVEMLICTTRYYTGSRTISASTWAEDLARHWASLPEGARIVIKRDLENAFERDNTSRQNREKYHALGDDCDRVMWEKVRAAWMREEAKEAQGRVHARSAVSSCNSHPSRTSRSASAAETN